MPEGVAGQQLGREAYAGTGIGLAIVKKIVENHNGLITTSSALGKGRGLILYSGTGSAQAAWKHRQMKANVPLDWPATK